jgi:hypothetical protein
MCGWVAVFSKWWCMIGVEKRPGGDLMTVGLGRIDAVIYPVTSLKNTLFSSQ